GGSFKPTGVTPRAKLAVIIPFRNRHLHLRMLMHYLHPVLRSQRFEYRIYVINQTNEGVFNKGSLMNVGYLEALKHDNYDCYVFHDVDLLPEEYRCLYTCGNDVRHISTGISKFGYKIPVGVTVGGISAFTRRQMALVNGWSNEFYGWGGEDDDMSIRIAAVGLKIRRPSPTLCKFTSLPHGADLGNPLNKNRFRLLQTSKSKMAANGVNSVRYAVLGV
uniref:Galactosyltransferase N-terminal domain-containing protein n=1 Tax=Ciona savignyi TaxID=51511 RepID=H2Y8B9_CIOSA